MAIQWKVQVSLSPNRKSGYVTKYTCQSLDHAWLWYQGINIGNGYKKRILEIQTEEDGDIWSRRVIERKVS